MAVIEALHIAKEYTIGNTNVQISDDYCKNKTPQDVEKILQRIARISIEHLNAAMSDKC